MPNDSFRVEISKQQLKIEELPTFIYYGKAENIGKNL